MGSVDACFDDTDCDALVTCLNNCSTGSCQQDCVDDHPSGFALFDAIFVCVCDNACNSECGSEAMCQEGGGAAAASAVASASSSGVTVGAGGAAQAGAGAGGAGSGAASGDGWVAPGTKSTDYDGTVKSSMCAAEPQSFGPSSRGWLALMVWGLSAAGLVRRRSARSR
jgi:hypothetical protein